MQKTHYLFLLCQHFKLQILQQSISSLLNYYTNALVKWDLHVKMFKYAVLFVWINKQIHLLMLGQILAVFVTHMLKIFIGHENEPHYHLQCRYYFINLTYLLPFWYTIDRSTTLYDIGKNLPLSTKSIKYSFVMTA